MTQATTSDRPLPVTTGRRRRRFGLATAALGAALLGSTVAPSNAEAAVPRVLRPGTRPMQFLFGLGPSWGIGGSSHYYDAGYYGPGCGAPGFPCRYGGFGYWGSFKLTQEFSGHFSGNASGPALGVLLNEEFGYRRFGFVIAPKFTYDIQVKRDLGLYISPNVSLGYQLLSDRWNYYNGAYYHYTNHAANLQFGVGLKLMLDDRWIVWLQFPQFDMSFGPRYGYGCGAAPGACPAFFIARLNLLLGGGVSF
ncbi:hypothetical protein OV203_34920 [Nannocystis sp. ILAH1]|uniref:hypothetical protein n=2 Tax=unclassified Nannocystis TaxID=2627009 RepID=UPI00226F0488|nr:hypothetical protein [Nannocystis sp. ILAH1]MCY0992384.1 hypothetical protein [Nannocystis sp. ILAH1]